MAPRRSRSMIASSPMRKKLLFILIWAALASVPPWGAASGLHAQEDPWAGGSVGTGLLLRKLDGVKRVLMIGAHPDDEDTALLAALARGMGAEAAYLSLSRGEGGQNLLGPELDEGLGLVRTGELLAARTLDGGKQFFSRAFDFGYSKSAEETLRFWPREEILRDVTWVVRRFRPHVIVSVFSGTPLDGHGHHEVAGMMAHEVFHVAGDPSRFPDQMAEGGAPWTPLKLYRLTRRNPEEGGTVVETGSFDPLLGRSHFQVAMQSRSQHRSQDMGAAQPLGPRRSALALAASRVETHSPDELFAGVDTTLLGLARGLGEPAGPPVREALEEYRGALGRARQGLSVTEPWGATSHVGRALEALEHAFSFLGGLGGPEGGSQAADELRGVLEVRLPVLREALMRSAGIVADVRIGADLLVPGETVEVTVEVWNGGPFRLAGLRTELELPPGWSADPEDALEGRERRDLAPGEVARWVLRVRVPANAEPSRLYYLREARDGAMYRWPEDSAAGLQGTPGRQDPVHALLSMEVEGAAPLTVRRAGRFRGVDKASGEYSARVLVVPALSVALEPSSLAWPRESAEPRELTVHVSNQAGEARRGTVRLEAPPGWGVSPREHTLELAGAGAETSVSFLVIPPARVPAGVYAIRARVGTPDGLEYGEGLTLVDYPHIPRAALFPPAEATISVFPVEVEAGLRVGYVMGSGDVGAEAIRQMGAQVELLDAGAVRAGAYQGLDAVVLGIRAYETRPDLVAANDRLLDYARGGGTVIVQYNKYEYPEGGFAPYAVTMSRPHDRVTDETVPVRILRPDHPVFRYPNPIDSRDFDGWIQERGLYFLRSWDERFTPLLEMGDPGEDPLRGGLLVAKVGEGAYVYTGLSLFRQLPGGVPGAHRLLANLISLRGSQLHAP